MANNQKNATRYLTRMAALVAIILVMTIANIGNIPVGPIVATIYQVPVLIGAVLLGTGAGALLGGVWGILCFFLALTGNTTDVVALGIINQSPFLFLAIAVVPRVLMGLLAGLLYQGLTKALRGKQALLRYAITGAVGSLMNTAFYLGALYILVRPLIASVLQMDIGAVGALIMSIVASNGLVEAAVCCVLVTAICRALIRQKPAQE